ncbi:hypothetical protein O7623_26985 [Solwaraspora sp. WMMD791]|uniref:hypothetical protein n=1 Tax=Solwaraspora sp. WMMD791 TaxID=3016086 RepID=UPI00249A95E8|nr:hypothetical protein [Solwaraspora sp. WMMD791]WFE26875.1 hypothetical protein O7623_26985 [Solwaraspora sp. WMMD791]
MRRTRTGVVIGLVVVLALVVAGAVWLLNQPEPTPPVVAASPSGAPADDDTDPAAADPDPAGPELLITPEGIGGLRLGASVAALTGDGSLGTEPGEACPDRLVGNARLAGVVVHTAGDGTAAMILVEDGPLSTADGIGVGSTAAALRQAYGVRLVRHTAENNPYAENYVVGDGAAGLGFTVSQDAVGKILVAPTDVLRAVFDAGEFHC